MYFNIKQQIPKLILGNGLGIWEVSASDAWISILEALVIYTWKCVLTEKR